MTVDKNTVSLKMTIDKMSQYKIFVVKMTKTK